MVWHLYSAFSMYVHIQMRFKTLSGGPFDRLLDGAMHNLNVTSRIHRCPQNTMSETRPQHQELHALLFTNSVWVI